MSVFLVSVINLLKFAGKCGKIVYILVRGSVMTEITFDGLRELIPQRGEKVHKGSFGTLLSVCGSARYRGAALLSSEAALRCGCGILRLASTERVCAAVASSLPEVTFLPQDEDECGAVCNFDCDGIFSEFKGITAILCGCGLTVSRSTSKAVNDIIRKSEVQLILDADALNCVAAHPWILTKAKMPPIITPHWGEFARLCGCDASDIEKNAERSALEFAEKYNCIVVLKSHFTLIAAPEGECFISNAGNAGLARGGSGDVLAGIIASFSVQGVGALNAAKLGVALHGAAADVCAKRCGMTAMLPHDIITDIRDLLNERNIKE